MQCRWPIRTCKKKISAPLVATAIGRGITEHYIAAVTTCVFQLQTSAGVCEISNHGRKKRAWIHYNSFEQHDHISRHISSTMKYLELTW